MNEELLVKNLVKLRKEKGLTQKELAEQINYSDKVISKWERNESIPDVNALMMIASFYNVTLDDLTSNNTHYENANEKVVLEILKTKGPSNLVIIVLYTIWFLNIFLVLLFAMLFFSTLLLLSFIALIVFSLYFSYIMTYVTFTSNYKGHEIKVVNKISKLIYYVDHKIVKVDNGLFALSSTCISEIENSSVVIEVSIIFTVKCNMHVQ